MHGIKATDNLQDIRQMRNKPETNSKCYIDEISYRLQRVYTDGETKEDLRNKDRNFVASFAFCVITFEPIMIQTCSAAQNDRQNFSFVKDTYVDGEKLARNGRKLLIQHLFRLIIEGF